MKNPDLLAPKAVINAKISPKKKTDQQQANCHNKMKPFLYIDYRGNIKERKHFVYECTKVVRPLMIAGDE